MKLGFSEKEQAFRAEVRAWLTQQMEGPFAHLRGVSFSSHIEERIEWEQHLAKAGYSVMAWPEQYGGRDATLAEQVIWAEEYVRAGAPARVNYIGIELAGSTLRVWGTEAQKQRFLPALAQGKELWAQGFSEPGAGSDLAGLRTKATLTTRPDGRKVWVIEGQKIWTSFAHVADWAFVLCRTEPGSKGGRGVSFMLVPMRQPGITVRPIRQMTSDAEFNEVFFDGAETDEENVVGPLGEGFKVAMSTLTFERGVTTFDTVLHHKEEFRQVIAFARANGKLDDPVTRQKLGEAYAGLRVMEQHAWRILSAAEHGKTGAEMLVNKLYFTSWHQKFMSLALDVIGPEVDYTSDPASPYHAFMRKYLFACSDTIYGGTSQIQRNIISERALGLPREPKLAA